MIKHILNTDKIKYLIGLLYAYIFYRGYFVFLNKYFDYAGFRIIEERKNDIVLLLLSFIIAIFPLLFYKGVKKISSFLCVFIYYFLYIPIIVTYYFNMVGDNIFVIYQQLLFLFGMSLLFSADKFYVKNNFALPSRIDVFKIILLLAILTTSIVIVAYRSNLKFVSFDKVYEQRFENMVYNSNPFIGYSIAFLSNAFIPLCISFSLFTKKKLYFIIGCLGALIIYMATAAKSVLLLPLLIFLLYRFLKNTDLRFSFNYIGIGLIFLMVLSLCFDFNIFSSILWYRTIGNAGLLSRYYHEFFQTHEFTYYSHINFINAITNSYPYKMSVGEMVGHTYWGESNANANFWATDGYAAIGDFGIIISSFLLFFVFLLLNKILNSYKLLFVTLCLIPYCIAITNSSLFQSLFTGGAIIVTLTLSFISSKKNKFLIK